MFTSKLSEVLDFFGLLTKSKGFLLHKNNVGKSISAHTERLTLILVKPNSIVYYRKLIQVYISIKNAYKLLMNLDFGPCWFGVFVQALMWENQLVL